ncbi:hypothetical protein [Streptomyces griseus]|uniref:hypothetical protein n=1 Tax=Streptomyces griseus TaxID=1911 RepID=UPI0037A79826
MTTDPHAQVPARSFTDVLNLLIQASATEDPDNPGVFVEYTNQQIAGEINRVHGPKTITAEYIRRLRKGDIKSPSVNVASLLARFFQVPLDTFDAIGGEKAERVMAEAQRFVDARRQTPKAVAVMARAARRLSPAGQEKAARYVARLEELEAMEGETGVPPSSN